MGNGLSPPQTCDGEIRCVVLKCPLQGMDGTSLELRSRLWNSTFIEVTRRPLMSSIVSRQGSAAAVLPRLICFVFTQDYASTPNLHIVVKASLVLHTQAKNMILRTPHTDVSTSTAA